MADHSTPVDVRPEPRPDSNTGVRLAVLAPRSPDALTEEIELLAEDLIEEIGAAPGIPPLPAFVLGRAKPRVTELEPPSFETDVVAYLKQELDRVVRVHRDQTAYVTELEKVFEQRSQELLEADDREASLVRRFHAQTLRITELEQQVREQASQIQALQAALPPRPSQDSELLKIRGIGRKYARTLAALGVETLAALAALGDADVSRIEQQLRIRNGRIQRECWVQQAQALLATTPSD